MIFFATFLALTAISGTAPWWLYAVVCSPLVAGIILILHSYVIGPAPKPDDCKRLISRK